MEYPKREAFFAVRFLRLLTKSAAMMHIGMDGFAMLMVIVGQEDACRYTRPVNFWNTQLSNLLGMRGADEHGVRRIRDRCVKAGWLQYQAGNKQQPAAYFVTIPAAVNLLSDSSCDESPYEYLANNTAIPAQTRQESGENPAGKRQESGENPAPSMPFPSPNPIPSPNAQPDGEGDPFNGQSQSPEKKDLKATGRDLFQVLRGCLTYFGKDHGIACLDAALMIYDAPKITRVVRDHVTASRGKIPADDLLVVLDQATKPPPEKIESPETLPPRIDIQHLLATGQIRLNPERDAGVA
jgi:hypothetical protein